MPVHDTIHDAVKNALVKDGWTITADPYRIEYEDMSVFADLAADRPLAAERAGEKIVVETKSFLGPSLVHDLEVALGQFQIYRGLLELTEPERKLYLAVSSDINDNFFERKSVQVIAEKYQLSRIVVDLDREEILKWIS